MADSKNSKPTAEENEEERVDERKYFEKVLDDVVSLNSLFTVAVFVGLSLAQPGQVHSLEDDDTCHPDIKIRKRLVAFEIASFSCFVFSGFLAKTVKIFLYIYKKRDGLPGGVVKNPHRQWKSLVGFYFSIYMTMVGCLLLLLAMVDVVQIKLGRLSCDSEFAVSTVSVMVGTIGLSLLIYFTTVTYGLVFTAKNAPPQGKAAETSKGVPAAVGKV
ncbi:uncharacterized protein LOC115690683 isoform X1 [Syzygium oleosum]|uniref:uncharacterized protein LOC115690683 isoform X1 n=1 Tax=Syzygium oleosum TaxID=219896 RepID=UPI0011D21BBF|nr:uncharacterized protein LOC115690683 isoform X1 [Syzygium oleosum]